MIGGCQQQFAGKLYNELEYQEWMFLVRSAWSSIAIQSSWEQMTPFVVMSKVNFFLFHGAPTGPIAMQCVWHQPCSVSSYVWKIQRTFPSHGRWISIFANGKRFKCLCICGASLYDLFETQSAQLPVYTHTQTRTNHRENLYEFIFITECMDLYIYLFRNEWRRSYFLSVSPEHLQWQIIFF